MTSAENQLYRFNYCLALMLVTIFFSNWFLQNIEEGHFNCLFKIICRWNLFRTICANSRKVGLGKFLSPYKDIDLSHIPVNKGTNSRLRWKKYTDLYEIVHLSHHWSVMQERSIINACRLYSLQWPLHMFVWQFLFGYTLSKFPIMDCLLQLPEVVSFWLVHW